MYRNMFMSTYRQLCVCTAASLLVACGGGSSSPSCEGAECDPVVIDYSNIKPSNISPEHLKPASKAELASLLKNGMRLDIYDPKAIETPETVDDADSGAGDDSSGAGAPINVPVSTEAGDAADGGNSADAPTATRGDGGFSETNVHVAGVDEADYVKYDGEHIFMATSPQYYWGEGKPESKIRILKTDPDNAGAEEVGSISIEDDYWGELSQLYLVQNEENETEALTTLRSGHSFYYFDDVIDIAVDLPAIREDGTDGASPEDTNSDEPDSDDSGSDNDADEPVDSTIDIARPFMPIENRIQLAIHDVSDPANPELSWKLEIDGTLQGSRKIGNTLYLITQYYPYLPSIIYYANSDAEKAENEEAIAAAELSTLLPDASINDGEDFPLIEDNDCMIPVDTQANFGYHSLMTVVAVSLDTKEIVSTACLNANIQGIYSSGENLYIGGSDSSSWFGFESFTVIHKFALNEGDISYRSTGTVPGSMGWSDPSFRMDEKDNYLRVVTTTRNENWEPKHHLSVLKDEDATDNMEIVAQLPNDDQPDPIGKPNEDIFSVRFIGDRGYVVTFERIDPLYVIDLSNPEAPAIAGELEVPGFSSYLHPVGGNYLLGVGTAADEEGIQGGVKLSLYDVSDMSDPQEVNNLEIGASGSSTPVSHDLRAFSFLQTSDDQLRLTMPISVYENNWMWQHNALYLFEINGLAADTAELTSQGHIISNKRTDDMPYSYFWTGRDRGVMHDEAVYYTHGENVWSAFWSAPDAVIGPH